MRADNTPHLRAAARARSARTRDHALAALRRLDTNGAPITLQGLAREAGVSRSWIYNQPDLRAEIQRLRHRDQPSFPALATPARQRASADSLLRRLQAATERIQRLERENQDLHDSLARTLGASRTARILGTAPPRDTPGRQATKLIGPC
jgi:Family of unknown function (DUF6262)